MLQTVAMDDLVAWTAAPIGSAWAAPILGVFLLHLHAKLFVVARGGSQSVVESADCRPITVSLWPVPKNALDHMETENAVTR